MIFKRLLDPIKNKSSVFVFGPRMTGKTTLIRSLPFDQYFDLLDPELELRYRSNPGLFREQIFALPGKRIIVDEVQKVPELLNYIQTGIDRLDQTFILSGSSSRKLRRGGANLLGGRAIELHLHALTAAEIGDQFNIDYALQYGTIPKIASLWIEKQVDIARAHLKSYLTTYIKEEIQAEALTRNVGAFQRFLDIAGQDNAQVLEFANIARESSVPASTVKEYYQILVDTLLGFFIWPYGHSERKKARSKFYFFDCGVTRSLQNRLQDKPTPKESGFLFETWFAGELLRIRDYYEKPYDFSFWRERNHEIDFIITRNNVMKLAIECKTSIDFDTASIRAFQQRYPGIPVIVASLCDVFPPTTETYQILPWRNAIEYFTGLE